MGLGAGLPRRAGNGDLGPTVRGARTFGHVEAEMRKRIADRLAQGPGLTVAEIRDLLGTTRKYAVPLCEYLDRIGVTRREGDLRFLAQEEKGSVTGSEYND